MTTKNYKNVPSLVQDYLINLKNQKYKPLNKTLVAA